MRLLPGIQSALDPHGPQAEVIAEITLVLFAGGSILFIAIMALGAYAVFGPRPHSARWRSHALIVGGGLVLPAVVLALLLVYTFLRTAAIAGEAEDPPLTIEVTGYQWWWRIAYLDAAGEAEVVTANELRLPAGRSAVIALESADVIHSFWVPALAGKMDLIPGRTNRLRIRADRTGQWRGQCAEYCGGPHGLMAFAVIVETPDGFSRWLDAQRRPAAAPQTEPARSGQALFLEYCAGCHTVRGTRAEGRLGPDLTHVASRSTIGAGVLPSNPGTFAAWIAGSQHLKPGNLMPSFGNFSGEELRALAGYLSGLE
jgi:cytochrome c oxidase subunit 2